MKPLRQGDGLVGESFGRIPDHRGAGPDIPLRDALLSGFAMFSLKDPSLLAFDKRRSDANLKALERFEFYHGGYLLLLEGTGYFSPQKIHCARVQVSIPRSHIFRGVAHPGVDVGLGTFLAAQALMNECRSARKPRTTFLSAGRSTRPVGTRGCGPAGASSPV